MSLIVETGAVVTGAESYCTVAYALTHHSNLGNDTWATITTAQQEQALRRATMYMTQMYRMRWKGTRVQSAQNLDWPRAGVSTDPVGFGSARYPSWQYLVQPNIVPDDIQRACAELAIKAAAGDLFPDATQKASQETIGPITVKYEQGSAQRAQFAAVEALLAPYLSSLGGVSVGLVKG